MPLLFNRFSTLSACNKFFSDIKRDSFFDFSESVRESEELLRQRLIEVVSPPNGYDPSSIVIKWQIPFRCVSANRPFAGSMSEEAGGL